MTVLLIEDSPEYVELVQAWLALDKQNPTQLQWTDTLAAGLNRLKAGNIDVVLLDLGLPDSEGPATFHRIREQSPNVPIIVLSGADSESLAIEMIRHGADDYLVKSSCDAATLARSLRYAMVRHGAKPARTKNPNGCRSIGFIGAKGGVGTTTLCCLFAAELRKQTGQDVLAADFESDGGLAGFLTGAEASYSAKDAVENLRRLDRSVWDRLVSVSSDGLPILVSPAFFGSESLDAGSLSAVIEKVRPFYKFLAVDLGRLNPTCARIVTALDEVLLVTTTAITSLYAAKRSISELLKAGITQDAIKMIVNNNGESQELSRKDLTSAFGVEVLGAMPYDYSEVHKASVERRLPSDSSSIRREMVNLVREFAGLEPIRRKSILPLFFSRDRTGTSDR